MHKITDMFTAVVLLDHNDRLVLSIHGTAQCVRDAIVHIIKQFLYCLSLYMELLVHTMYKGMSS